MNKGSHFHSIQEEKSSECSHLRHTKNCNPWKKIPNYKITMGTKTPKSMSSTYTIIWTITMLTGTLNVNCPCSLLQNFLRTSIKLSLKGVYIPSLCSTKNLWPISLQKKQQLVSMATLNRVTQGKKETLQAYIDWFTKVGVAIGGTNESIKYWIFKIRLQSDNVLW